MAAGSSERDGDIGREGGEERSREQSIFQSVSAVDFSFEGTSVSAFDGCIECWIGIDFLWQQFPISGPHCIYLWACPRGAGWMQPRFNALSLSLLLPASLFLPLSLPFSPSFALSLSLSVPLCQSLYLSRTFSASIPPSFLTIPPRIVSSQASQHHAKLFVDANFPRRLARALCLSLASKSCHEP